MSIPPFLSATPPPFEEGCHDGGFEDDDFGEFNDHLTTSATAATSSTSVADSSIYFQPIADDITSFAHASDVSPLPSSNRSAVGATDVELQGSSPVPPVSPDVDNEEEEDWSEFGSAIDPYTSPKSFSLHERNSSLPPQVTSSNAGIIDSVYSAPVLAKPNEWKHVKEVLEYEPTENISDEEVTDSDAPDTTDPLPDMTFQNCPGSEVLADKPSGSSGEFSNSEESGSDLALSPLSQELDGGHEKENLASDDDDEFSTFASAPMHVPPSGTDAKCENDVEVPATAESPTVLNLPPARGLIESDTDVDPDEEFLAYSGFPATVVPSAATDLTSLGVRPPTSRVNIGEEDSTSSQNSTSDLETYSKDSILVTADAASEREPSRVDVDSPQSNEGDVRPFEAELEKSPEDDMNNQVVDSDNDDYDDDISFQTFQESTVNDIPTNVPKKPAEDSIATAASQQTSSSTQDCENAMEEPNLHDVVDEVATGSTAAAVYDDDGDDDFQAFQEPPSLVADPKTSTSSQPISSEHDSKLAVENEDEFQSFRVSALPTDHATLTEAVGKVESGVEPPDATDDFDDFDEFKAAAEPVESQSAGEWAAFGEKSAVTAGAEADDDDWAAFQEPPPGPPCPAVPAAVEICPAQPVIVYVSAVSPGFMSQSLSQCFPPNSSRTSLEEDTKIPSLTSLLADVNEGRETCDKMKGPVDHGISVWRGLKVMENTAALKYQWHGSRSNDLLLKTVNVDARNILTGHRKPSAPAFASGLGLLEPKKATTPTEQSSVSSVPASQESVWRGSYDRPTYGHKTDVYELMSPSECVARKHEKELLDVLQLGDSNSNAQNTKTRSTSLDTILKAISASSSASSSAVTAVPVSTVRRLDGSTEPLSAEASAVLGRLPDLSFMHAKVLMFPVGDCAN